MMIQKFLKTRTKKAALSPFLALQNLHKNTNAIQKSNKGQSLVIADKADYLDKMENLLNDTRTFEKLFFFT